MMRAQSQRHSDNTLLDAEYVGEVDSTELLDREEVFPTTRSLPPM